MPEIHDVSQSSQVVGIGQSFNLTLTGVNIGDSADFQTISAGFPNLTTIYGFVKIIHSDFIQKPILIKKDEMVGSSYQGTGNLISAKYPSIEAFSQNEFVKAYSIQVVKDRKYLQSRSPN
jgi:hypothetical protein